MQQAAAQTPWRLHYHTKRAHCTKPRKPQKDRVLTSAVDRTASPRGEQRQAAHRCDPSHNHQLSATTKHTLVNTKHLYNICTMLVQRRTLCRHFTHVIQRFCVWDWTNVFFFSQMKKVKTSDVLNVNNTDDKNA